MHKIVHFPFSPIRVNATCTLGHDRSRTFDAGAATFASIERLKQTLLSRGSNRRRRQSH